MKQTVSWALLFTFLFFFSGLALGGAQIRAENKMAKEFSLVNLQDKAVNLSDYKGKPVILFFWSTWCPYCRQEFPKLTEKYSQISAKGIELLAIDIGEPKQRVENFLQGKNAEFQVLLDQDSKVAYANNLVGVPTFILIDSQGFIRWTGNDLPDDYAKILNIKS